MTEEQGYLLEFDGPGGATEARVTNTLDVGRESGDVVLDDPAVSGLHLRFEVNDHGLVITDLESSNGTFVQGQRITTPTVVVVRHEIRVGDTTIRVAAAPTAPASTPTTRAIQQVEPAPSPMPSTSPAGLAHSHPVSAVTPAHTSQSLRTEAVEVRYSPGTYGEQVAKSYASTAARARKRLAGLGSEPWGTIPVVHLIDPYHDGQELIASGSIVDASRGEAWVIASPEAPPEEPDRLLALLFGGALPSATELEIYIEGYGLHRSGVPDPDDRLAESTLPPLREAEGELRGLMALSFVRFLVEREGDDGVMRLLGSPDGRIDETAREVFGAALGQLEQTWRRKVAAGEPDVKTRDFVRLSLRYLRPYKAKQAEIFGYMLLSLAFTAAFPFVTMRLFDTALPSGEFSQVLTLLVALGAAFVVSLIAGVRQAYQTAWVSGAVTRDIRQSIFARVQRLPASWYSDHPQGDVLSRLFSDVGVVEQGLSQAIGQGIFQIISLVVSSVIMLTINFWMGLIVLVAAPIVGIVYKQMSGGAQDRSLAVQENNSALLSVAAENYHANPVVKMFGLAAREERRFAQQGDRLFRATRRLVLWGGLFGLSVNLIMTLLRLGILGFGAWLILEGEFTTGGLVAFLSIMGEVLSPVTSLVGLSQDVQASMGSLIRIDEVMDAPLEPEGEDLPVLGRLTRELRLAGVGLSYTPDRRALDDFDVSIAAGSRVAFVGPSGSGKSTVLRLLMRMYEPDEGAIFVDGNDLRSCSMRSWRDQVGVVFQDSFLFDATVRENIAFGRAAASDADIEAAAQAAEIDDFVDSLPNGYNSLVGEGGSNLSGGQRQRVAIARALVRNPQVLLLDEATSALDPATERQINDTIERIAKGRTVIAVTHRLASITDYDRIFVIVEGRLAEQGTHDDLILARGAYASLWAEQIGSPLPEQPPFNSSEALRRVPFLSDVSEDTILALSESLTSFSLETNNILEDGDGLVLIAEGHAEVLNSHAEVVAELRAGEAFGAISVLGGPVTGKLRALEPTRVLGLSRAAIEKAAAEDPYLSERLGGGSRGPSPAKGTRLTRLTLGGPSPTAAVLASKAPVVPAGARSTGAFTRVS